MNATLAIQRPLAIKVEMSAPLMDVSAVKAILAVDEDGVLELIALGALAWAWNIGRGDNRREMRVLARCVRGFQTTSKLCGLAEKKPEEIIGEILARDTKPFLTGKRLAHLLNCSSELIIDLIKDGGLSVLKGSSFRRGREGTPLITRASVETFLKQRREKACLK